MRYRLLRRVFIPASNHQLQGRVFRLSRRSHDDPAAPHARAVGSRSPKMTGWGAQIKPEDREAILKYLSDSFKP